MRRSKRKNRNEKKSVGKILTGALVGSVVGATVGLLMAPASGEELRHRIRTRGRDSRAAVMERIKTAEGNVESRAREVAAKVNKETDAVKKTVIRRRKTAAG
jgi:gas vesicle protein